MSPKYKRPLTAEELILSNAIAERLYEDLYRWLRWLASAEQIPGNWLLNADDIMGECGFVVVKIARSYMDKPYEEALIVCKASAHNAIGALKHKICISHRKAEFDALSLDQPMPDSDDVFGDIVGHVEEAFGSGYSISPENFVEAVEEFLDKIEDLSSLDLRVLSSLLGYDEATGRQVRLSIARRSFVYKEAPVTITPLIVARALGESIEAVEESFERIRSVLWT